MACTMPENTLCYYTDFRASRAYHPEYDYNNRDYNGEDIVSIVPSVRFDEIFKKADPRKVQCITLRLLNVKRVLAALRNIIKLLQKCPNCIYFELILFEYPDPVLLDWKYKMDCRFHDLFYIIRSKCTNLRTVVIESLNAAHTRTLSHLFSSPHLERLELYKFNDEDEAMTQNYALKELIIPMYMRNTNPSFTFIYSSVQLSKKDIEKLEHLHSCRHTLCWLSNSRHAWCGEREARQIKMLLLYNSCWTQHWLPPEIIQLVLEFYFS